MNKELKNKGESLPLATKQSFSATPSSGDTPQRPVKTDCHSELQNCHSELVSESHFELQNCHSELVSESHFPNIRFAGFSDSWQEKKLGDVADVTSSKRIHVSDYVESGIPFYRGKEISLLKNHQQIEDILYISEKTFIELKTKFGCPQMNDLLITAVGTIGNSWVVDKLPFYFKDGNLIWLKSPKCDSNFLDYVLSSENGQKKINESASGSNQKALTIIKLNELSFSFPALTEQQKIGSYFATLDKKITAQKAKVEQLKTLKKYMLQNMFPQTIKNAEQQNCHSALENCDSELQNCHSELVSESHFKQQNCHSELVSESHFEQQNCHSELVSESHFPKIRFAGFSDPWEEKKLGEIGIATSGISLEHEFNKDGKYKVINIGSYSESSIYTDQGLRINKTSRSENRILNKGDLTMILNDKTSSGNIIGRVLLINENDTYVYNQRTQRIEPNKKLYDSMFLYQLFNADNIRVKIIRAAQGNTQIYVNWSVIKDFLYPIPSLPEQQKIGSYFATLDKNIANQNAKLGQLQTLKKYMLQNMFC